MSSGVMRFWVGLAVVEVVTAAERVGLLSALCEPGTAAELAKRLGLSERALALALPVLVALGYLERFGDVFRRGSDALGLTEPWPELETFVRTGRVPEVIDRPERRGAYYAKCAIALGAALEPDARELAELLPPVARIADVGAGSAVWSLAMAARHDDGRAIAIDLPEVQPAADKMAANMRLGERLIGLAGDYFEVRPEEQVDRVVMANVLHLETEADAARLVRHHTERLAPDGELVIVDCFGGDGFLRQFFAAAYPLHLGMRTARGRAHELDDLVRWCADAGLTHHVVFPLGSGAMSALVCSRRPPRSPGMSETTTFPVSELAALRERCETAEARLRMFVEGNPEALLIIDKRDHAIVQTNAPFGALVGADWSSFEIRSLSDVVAPEDLTRFEEVLAGLANGTITERRHLVGMLRDGVRFTAELTAYDPLRRSVIGFVVRDRDRMAREERLQALGELVAAISHDLNTPLGSLKANCTLARDLARRGADSDARLTRALSATTEQALLALDDIAAKLGAIAAFANLEGEDLKALAPHVKSGLARAICERAAKGPAIDRAPAGDL